MCSSTCYNERRKEMGPEIDIVACLLAETISKIQIAS